MDEFLFIGRTDELRDLRESVLNFMLDQTGDALQMIQITGPPAIGKTLLVKQVSIELDLECNDNGFHIDSHFIDLQGETRMANVLKQVGIKFGSCVAHSNAHQVIREFIGSRYDESKLELLVLDGIEDILSAEESGGDFLEFCEELLEQSSRVFILVTSTVKFQLPRSVTKLRNIENRPLEMNERKNGLLVMSVNIDLGQYLDDLADCSEGFPIAILLIVAILKVGGISPEELVDRLRRAWIDTLINGEYSGNMARVKSVINVCLESMPRRLRRDYRKLAFIPASFTGEAARSITSSSSSATATPSPSIAVIKHDLLSPLQNRSLIDIYDLFDSSSRPTRFHIHQFLRAFVEDKYTLVGQDLNEVRSRYCAFYGRLLLNIVPLLEGNYAKHLPVFQVEIRNIEKLLREAIHCLGENTNIFMDVAYKAKSLIETFLPTAEAVEFYKACVNAAQNPDQSGGVNQLYEARMLLSYGIMLGTAKTDFTLEYEQYMKAMRLLRHRGDTLDMAMLLYSIAGNLHSRGMRMEAITHLHEALNVLNRLEESCSSNSREPGPLMMDDDPSCTDVDTDLEANTRLAIRRCRANADYLLGVTYAWIGKTSEAEQHHLRSLQVKRELWGENHPSIGVGYNGLSLVYERTQQPEKASRFCFLGLDVKEKFLKEPSIGMIVSFNNAARHLSQQRGEHQRALDLLDKSYTMRKQLGLNHRDTSLIYNNRGKVYTWMGDSHNARINFEKAVELRKNYLGEHASTAGSMLLLGECYLELGDYQNAVDSLEGCLGIFEKVHMKEQPLSDNRANTLKPLAKAYYGLRDLGKSEELYQRTLEEFQRLGREFGAIGKVFEQIKAERERDDVQQKLDSVRQERIHVLPNQKEFWKVITIVMIIVIMVIWVWYDVPFPYLM